MVKKYCISLAAFLLAAGLLVIGVYKQKLEREMRWVLQQRLLLL